MRAKMLWCRWGPGGSGRIDMDDKSRATKCAIPERGLRMISAPNSRKKFSETYRVEYQVLCFLSQDSTALWSKFC